MRLSAQSDSKCEDDLLGRLKGRRVDVYRQAEQTLSVEGTAPRSCIASWWLELVFAGDAWWSVVPRRRVVARWPVVSCVLAESRDRDFVGGGMKCQGAALQDHVQPWLGACACRPRCAMLMLDARTNLVEHRSRFGWPVRRSAGDDEFRSPGHHPRGPGGCCGEGSRRFRRGCAWQVLHARCRLPGAGLPR
ncbi:MAG: hypothetical protein AW12_03037 [Candidatus Accumulibacter sp. BA-94]|nr:MAG: hypothetical protein AW12_03037 [Candidatus Accumulibacter sp. BA-94]